MSANATISPIAVAGLRERFQSGLVFNTLGAVFNQGSTLAVNILLANILGRTTFGQYAMVQSTLATLAVLSQLAVGYTATKYVAEFRTVDPRRAGGILGLLLAASTCTAAVAASILFYASPWLAVTTFRSGSLQNPLRYGAVVLLFSVVNGVLMGALAGLEAYKSLGIALTGSGVLYFALCTMMGWWRGLDGAVVGLACSAFLQSVLLASALARECRLQGIPLRLSSGWKERRILATFALPSALSGFTTMPALWLAGTFLVRQTDGYAQMAMYSAAFTLMMAVLFLPNVANNVGMSLLNHARGVANRAGYRRTFWLNLWLTLGIVLSGAAVAAVAGRQLLALYGKNFEGGYTTLLLLLLAAIPQAVSTALYQLVQSQGRMWLSFFAIALPRDCAVAGLAYFLIPKSGANGLASAYGLASLVALVSTLLVLPRLKSRDLLVRVD